MITKAKAEKLGYKEIEFPIKLVIDPATGNIFFPCDKCDKLFDRFVFITDPVIDDKHVVNVLCKDHKAKYQKRQFAANFEALLQAGAKIYLEGKWQKLTKKMAKDNDWFPIVDAIVQEVV